MVCCKGQNSPIYFKISQKIIHNTTAQVLKTLWIKMDQSGRITLILRNNNS